MLWPLPAAAAAASLACATSCSKVTRSCWRGVGVEEGRGMVFLCAAVADRLRQSVVNTATMLTKCLCPFCLWLVRQRKQHKHVNRV